MNMSLQRVNEQIGVSVFLDMSFIIWGYIPRLVSERIGVSFPQI